MKNKHYSNGDFAKDLKNSYKKPAKKSASKKKSALSPMGGTTQKLMNSAMSKTKVLGTPMPMGNKMPAALNTPNPSWVKQKKAKAKSTKKKVSHVLQESSMCKQCKTSHPMGKHMKASGVKKKR